MGRTASAARLAGPRHLHGTDGFPVAQGDPRRRQPQADLDHRRGDRTSPAYFYASRDCCFSYPHLAERDGPFKDRFTGTVLRPPLRLRRDFAELTAANELDIAAVNPDLRAQHGQDLLGLFTSWRDLLSETAWQVAQATLR